MQVADTYSSMFLRTQQNRIITLVWDTFSGFPNYSEV